MKSDLYSIRRDVVSGIRGITVVPHGTPSGGSSLELRVASSFQSAFRKAMDLAGWGGPARLSPEVSAS